MVKRIYITKGVMDHYFLSDTKMDDVNRKEFRKGYQEMIAYVANDSPELHRLKRRPLELVAFHFGADEIRKLCEDFVRSGFKNIQKITARD